MYIRYIEKDPNLPVSWIDYFDTLNEDINSVVKELEGPTWQPQKKKINLNKEKNQSQNINIENIELSKVESIKAIALIRAYRIRGHLIANLDPLKMMDRKYLHELHPEDN
jgi:2-oxoglutarate dehydrogenase E1 component